jgi:hypothetical protein
MKGTRVWEPTDYSFRVMHLVLFYLRTDLPEVFMLLLKERDEEKSEPKKLSSHIVFSCMDRTPRFKFLREVC